MWTCVRPGFVLGGRAIVGFGVPAGRGVAEVDCGRAMGVADDGSVALADPLCGPFVVVIIIAALASRFASFCKTKKEIQ
jgi:hypothetical protein